MQESKRSLVLELGIKKCTTCKGEGVTYISSHDCWGKAEWDCRRCSVCGGQGFVISSDLVSEIKSELGLIPSTKFGRG